MEQIEERNPESIALPEQPESQASAPRDFDTLDYVKELYLLTLEQREAETKRLRMQRIVTLLLTALVGLFLLGGILLAPTVASLNNVLDNANKAIAQVQEVDLKKTSQNLDVLIDEAIVSLSAVSEAAKVLETLDIEQLNDAISEMKLAIASISELDIATLNESILTFNAASNKIGKFFGIK